MKTSIFALMLASMAIALPGHSWASNPWKQMRKVERNIVVPTFPKKTFNIADFHQQKDTLYTDAINKAIQACHIQGGGMVVIPKGVYKTAAIHIRSGVNLHLEEGAVLQFSTDRRLYPIVLTRIEGIDCYNLSPLIYAYDEHDIAITGKGKLDGMATFEN